MVYRTHHLHYSCPLPHRHSTWGLAFAIKPCFVIVMPPSKLQGSCAIVQASTCPQVPIQLPEINTNTSQSTLARDNLHPYVVSISLSRYFDSEYKAFKSSSSVSRYEGPVGSHPNAAPLSSLVIELPPRKLYLFNVAFVRDQPRRNQQ
jgi:hypothetical protein